MNEIRLRKLIRESLLSGFTEQGLTISVQRNQQQLWAQTPSNPTLVYHRIATTPVHWTYSKTKVVAGRDQTEHHSNKLVTYQINAVVPNVNPEDETEDTLLAEDYLNTARMILQSRNFLAVCKGLGINVLSVTSVADVAVQNESDNWESQPSFDVTFAVKDILTQSVGRVESFDTNIYRV